LTKFGDNQSFGEGGNKRGMSCLFVVDVHETSGIQTPVSTSMELVSWWYCILPVDSGNAVQKEATSTQQPHSTSDLLSGWYSGQRPRDFIHSTQGSIWKLTLWSRGKDGFVCVAVSI